MNELTIPGAATPEVTQALQLHSDIMANMRAAATAMVDVCRDLKRMRDTKMYTELGYDKFEDYAEQAAGIKQRQAYTYISIYERLAPQLIANNAELGVTKLALLAQVSALDREDFAAQNDLGGMSVKEIEALIAEKRGLNEQISMLTAEQTAADSDRDIWKKECERLKTEVAEKAALLGALQQAPIDAAGTDATTPLDLEAIRAEASEEAQAEAKKDKAAAVKEAIKAERAKAEKAAEATAQKARAEMQKTIDEAAQKQSEAAQAATRAAEARAAELEKRLAIAGDKDTLRFSLLFDGVQRDVNAALALLAAMRGGPSKETATKLANAMAAMLSQAAACLQKEDVDNG